MTSLAGSFAVDAVCGEELSAELKEELSSVPEDVLGLFIASKMLPSGTPLHQFSLRAHRYQRMIIAVISAWRAMPELGKGVKPFTHASGEPALLVVLATERRTFWKNWFGSFDWEDRIEGYGPTIAEPGRVDGRHMDVSPFLLPLPTHPPAHPRPRSHPRSRP